jgi:6-phosphogluconolactonase (cycloisomerase 2 family)
VATWGIAHLTSGFPGQFQQPARVYVYDFNSKSGNATNPRFFEEAGVAGSIGFSWSPVSGRDLLYVSNFNLAEDKLDYGVTVLEATSQSVVSVQNFRTGETGSLVEDCWTAISRDGSVLWVSAFGANIVSSFQIGQADGYLSAVGGGNTTRFVSRPTAPVGDTKDLWPTPDGRWLYNLGAFESFKAVEFAINATSLSLVEEVPVRAATPRARGAFNFLGLTGFDFA